MSAKFIYNSDLHAFDAPSDETEGFIKAIRHSFDLLLRLIYEPPLYKLYPNKLYRDWKKTGEVSFIIILSSYNYIAAITKSNN